VRLSRKYVIWKMLLSVKNEFHVRGKRTSRFFASWCNWIDLHSSFPLWRYIHSEHSKNVSHLVIREKLKRWKKDPSYLAPPPDQILYPRQPPVPLLLTRSNHNRNHPATPYDSLNDPYSACEAALLSFFGITSSFLLIQKLCISFNI